MTIALVLVLAALALAGLLMTTFQVFLSRRFFGGRPFFVRRPRERAISSSVFRPDASTPGPRVSILKPLCGLDDDLEENLASFAALPGVSYEVVLTAADPLDPAWAVVERVRARFPDAPFVVAPARPSLRGMVNRSLIGEKARYVRERWNEVPALLRNRKVERLVAAAAVARGEILFISDSNARVAPHDVARTVAAFDDPSVGCVSNVFVARGAETLGARIEALHLLTFVVPGNVLAFSGEVPCVVGKSMALPRAVVERIGGFEAFLRVLAEDQAIGLAVNDAGWRVVLSPVVVSNVVIRRSVRRALERQARWNKIRYAFSKATYGGELLLNPFGVAALAALVAALLAPLALEPCLSLVAVSALTRMLQASLLSRATGAPCGGLDLALMPVKDLLQLFSQLAPYVSTGVTWHGFRAHLGPGTALLPPRELAGEVGALALS